MNNRQLISSGAPWEGTVGYSRAVRVGDFVFVAGTTATNDLGETIHVDDAYLQTKYVLEKIHKALQKAGADLSDVVRTRMYVTDITHWEAIGRAHGDVFREIRPAATMIEVARLIDPAHLVEIEVDAVIHGSHQED